MARKKTIKPVQTEETVKSTETKITTQKKPRTTSTQTAAALKKRVAEQQTELEELQAKYTDLVELHKNSTLCFELEISNLEKEIKILYEDSTFLNKKADKVRTAKYLLKNYKKINWFSKIWNNKNFLNDLEDTLLG